MLRTVELGGKQYQFMAPWTGGYVGKVLAIDTETELIKGPAHEPRMALMSVSSGIHHYLLYPDQVRDFFRAHWDSTFVFQNVAFDYHVLRPFVSNVLEEAVQENRVHDIMLLDQLVQLAEMGAGGDDDWGFKARNLGELTRDYLGVEIDKTDPYRLRYGEIIGKRFEEVEPGFLDYAIRDAIGTRLVYGKMIGRAKDIQGDFMARGTEAFSNAPQRFGVLTENIQVKASIALRGVTQLGITVSQLSVEQASRRVFEQIEEKVRWIQDNHPDLLDYYKEKKRRGQLKRNKNTLIPLFQLKALRVKLAAISQERGIQPPKTEKTGEVQASVPLWRDLLPDHPLVANWTELAELGKMYQFLVALRGKETVHPEFRTMVRTGRTSAYKGQHGMGLNIQQMPREPWFREMFIPRPGYKLVSIDYSFIELRTLASVCLARYGKSVLAEVIRKGVDPHAYTASMVEGVSLEEFLRWKKGTEEQAKRFKESRQAAKAINFGVPGGLGAKKLAVYAKQNYGVVMSENRAAALKRRLTTEIYPELATYLSDNSLGDLALNLDCPLPKLRYELGVGTDDRLGQAVRKILRGEAFKANGDHYNPGWVLEIWKGLEKVNKNQIPLVLQALARRQGSPQLESILFRRTTTTLTGRLRGGVGYTEARNTPFQGLAADGAKLALWELWRVGYRVVAFVHDEIVLEVPSDDLVVVKDAERIMNEAMEQVLFPGVSSQVESAVGDFWVKP